MNYDSQSDTETTTTDFLEKIGNPDSRRPVLEANNGAQRKTTIKTQLTTAPQTNLHVFHCGAHNLTSKHQNPNNKNNTGCGQRAAETVFTPPGAAKAQ